MSQHRREFLADVGKGMFVATFGATLATDLGLAPALADDADARLTFGDMEPLVALMQDNLKKRLAYSTVSQLSYVVLAVAILTPISVVGAAVHIAAHAVSKSVGRSSP